MDPMERMTALYAAQARALRPLRPALWVYFNAIDQANPMVQPISRAFDRLIGALDRGAKSAEDTRADYHNIESGVREALGRMRGVADVMDVAAGSLHTASAAQSGPLAALFKPGAAEALRDVMDNALYIMEGDNPAWVALRQSEAMVLIAELERLAEAHRTPHPAVA